MPICFLADADLNEDIVTGLVRREPRIDFQTAQAANLRALSDPEVLAMAARENRILVTHDRRTMPRHFADFIRRHQSPGVFVHPNLFASASRLKSYCSCGRCRTVKSGPI